MLRHAKQQVRMPAVAGLIAVASLTLPWSPPATAVASCGEPEQQETFDTDGDGDTDFTVRFDQCVTRTFEVDGRDKELTVYYTETSGRPVDRLGPLDTDGDGTDDLAPEAQAELVADWTQEAWSTYLAYGFDDPLGLEDFNVAIFKLRGPAGWCCKSSPPRYHFNAPSLANGLVNDVKNAKTIAYHEMWHASEWKGGVGGWVIEGTASNMTDHVNLPVDNDADNDYINRVRSYLFGRTDQSLTSVAYIAALFWQYYMEQTGSVESEPDRGRDAMLRFWDNLGTDGLSTLDDLIRSPGDGRTLRTLWTDFTVANFARQLSGDGVPDKYRYRDELQPGAPAYRDVNPNVRFTHSPGFPGFTRFEDVQPWAAKYYQFESDPDSEIPAYDIEFRQDTNRRLAYTMLVIRDDDIVEEVRKVGRHFARTVPNDDVDRVVVVVTAFQRLANYRVTFNVAEPRLDIADPLRTRRAMAGDPADPDKILVKVRLLNPDGTPIPGADPDDFEFRIAGETVPAGDIIATAYIQGQYWFLLHPPALDFAGVYHLFVDYAELDDVTVDSVEYRVRDEADNVLVIDRSGSMGDNGKLPAAQDAARLYVDAWREGDQIGVVSYDGDVRPDVDLGPFAGNRMPALNAIDDLMADGGTTIGGALLEAMDQLVTRGVDDPSGTDDHTWDVVLLSDGINTLDPPIGDFLDAYNSRGGSGGKLPRVHAVALGPDADRRAMQNLAMATGGTYQFASEPEPPAGSAMAAKATAAERARLFADLSEIYRAIGETVAEQQQIFSARGTIPADAGVVEEHVIAVDGGAREGVFVFAWPASSVADPQVELINPNGDALGAPTLADDGHRVWRVPNPMAGDWRLRVEGQVILFMRAKAAATDGTPYLAEAALKSDLTMETFVGLASEERLAGRAVPVLASLAAHAPVTGASVTARVTAPDGTVSDLPLHDDGRHGDGAAGDGFYGNSFSRTAFPGSYVLAVSASGTTPVGDAFTRRQRRSFDMADAGDGDGDGLPDWWEAAFGTDPERPDATADPDLDGLVTIDEFERGTHPFDSDSDGAGESDGSEVANGTNPADVADDGVVCPLDFQVDNHLHVFREEVFNPRASVLNWSIDESHDHYRIWRSTSADGPWTLIDAGAPPEREYLDADVVLGRTYYYRLQAVDAAGRRSCILGPRHTTPNEGAVPPDGLVLINDGAPATQSLDVTLSLDASRDAVEVLVSNRADFDGAAWRPHRAMLPWTIEPVDNRGVVFVRYRDAQGNESDVVSDSIRVVPTCDAATPDPEILWAPNHRLTPVDIGGVVDPDGDPVSLSVTGIFQDEPTDGRGDGRTCPDAEGLGTDRPRVRAERGRAPRQGGDGRVYHIRFEARDPAGAACAGEVRVCAPHDRGGRAQCVDQGPLHDSTACGGGG